MASAIWLPHEDDRRDTRRPSRRSAKGRREGGLDVRRARRGRPPSRSGRESPRFRLSTAPRQLSRRRTPTRHLGGLLDRLVFAFPVRGPSAPDLESLFGLTRITDRFGTVVLRVDQVVTHPSPYAWKIDRIVLSPDTGFVARARVSLASAHGSLSRAGCGNPLTLGCVGLDLNVAMADKRDPRYGRKPREHGDRGQVMMAVNHPVWNRSMKR